MVLQGIKEKGRNVLKSAWIFFSLVLLLCAAIPVSAETRSIDELRNSVVRIICYGTDGGIYIGSGFAVGKSEPVRHIVTNYHVIEPNPEGVTILLSKEDQIEAKVIAFDQVKDIAVLQLTQDLYKRPPMEIGDSETVKASDDVYALGFPGDADIIDDTPSGDPDDVTITRGIISKISTQGGRGIFQVDVNINSGNSGGPLLNENGQVIGINTFKVTSASGINGAVRIDELIPILESRGIDYLTGSVEKTVNKSLNSPQDHSNKLIWILTIAGVGFLVLIILVLIVVMMIRKKGNRQHPISNQSSPVPPPRVNGTKPVLIGVTGYFAGQTLELDRGGLTIGRDANQCQLIFPPHMEEISRKHCTLRFDEVNYTFMIEDSSSNGTFLQSGEKIPERKMTVLRSGDRFYISSRENTFEVRLERL